MLGTLLLLATVASPPMTGWQTSADALAERWAPVLIQEARRTKDNVTQDLPVAFDFDGDWDMGNNWANQPEHTRDARATVHWAAVATERRAYVTYYLFYPRNWARVCLPIVCHENDLEQFTLVIDNDGSKWGKPLLVDTKYHRSYRAYAVEGAGVEARNATTERLWLDPSGRPVLRIQSGGHAVLTCDRNGDGELDEKCRRRNPKHFAWVLAPEDGERFDLDGTVIHESYDLLPMRETLWRHREAGYAAWSGDSFRYHGARLGAAGLPIGYVFARSGPGGGARAPWGVRPRGAEAAGDRFFDPALAIDRRWKLPGGLEAADYVWHPYLDELRAETEPVDGELQASIDGE